MLGRPSDYTDELAERALELIASGATIRKTAREIGVPTMTLWQWVNDGRGLFVHSARAKESGFDAIADECVDIADDPDMPSDQKRIRIDTRIRLLGKWAKRYGDKVSHEVSVRRADELTDDELAALAGGGRAIAAPVSAGLTD